MLRRLAVMTAGESHGRGIFTTITGFPAGVPLDRDAVDGLLALRQAGFGRSARQRLEHDRADVVAGLLHGSTTGAPLVLAVWNADTSLEERPPVHAPRPGHADLAGGARFGTTDMRGVLERASARETAGRVAAGAVASQLLQRLGVEVLGHVLAIGAVAVKAGTRGTLRAQRRRRDASAFHVLDAAVEPALERAVRSARRRGDTLGGRIEVRAAGVAAGLGSLDTWGGRLDARLGAALLSIQAIKAVEVGDGIEAAAASGRAVHDAVRRPGPEGPRRGSNRAGGLEGGMTNGEPVVVRAFMKPLSTLARPLSSWDYEKGRPARAFVERSDVTAVPAAAIVAEAMVALVLLDAVLEKTGGDSLDEVEARWREHRARVARLFGARRRSVGAIGVLPRRRGSRRTGPKAR